MRHAKSQALLLMLAMSILIAAAVVLFATRGIHAAAVLVGIVGTLVVAHLVRHKVRMRLLYHRDADRQPHDPIATRRDRTAQAPNRPPPPDVPIASDAWAGERRRVLD